METIEVVEEQLKQTKKGDDYVNVKLSDGRYINLFFENFDSYDGPGKYEADIKRNGKFWECGKGSLRAFKNGQESPASDINNVKEYKLKSSIRERLASNTAQIDTNRAILVQVCIKSAAETYSGHPGVPDHDKVLELADSFLKFAEKALKPAEMEDAPF